MKKLWLQLLILVCVLAGVVTLIYQLNHSSQWSNSVALLFYGTDSKHQVNWCETRVKSIEVPGKFRVFQKGLKWYRQAEPDAVTYELGFVAVEKWFATYCSLPAEGKTEGLAAELSGPKESVLARVHFIDGRGSVFREIAEGIFTWDNTTFRSREMKPALKDLAGLPERGGPVAPQELDGTQTEH